MMEMMVTSGWSMCWM